jgi:hypothetical protein
MQIILTEAQHQKLLEVFHLVIPEQVIETILNFKDEIPSLNYRSDISSWDKAEDAFLATESDSLEERGLFRKLIELTSKEDLASTVDVFTCIETPEFDEKVLLVRKAIELLSKE